MAGAIHPGLASISANRSAVRAMRASSWPELGVCHRTAHSLQACGDSRHDLLALEVPLVLHRGFRVLQEVVPIAFVCENVAGIGIPIKRAEQKALLPGIPY